VIKEASIFPDFLGNKKSIKKKSDKIYSASFMPVNFVLHFCTDKRSIELSCF